MSEQPEAERPDPKDAEHAATPPAPGGPQRGDVASGPLTAGGPKHDDDTTTDTEGQ